MTFDFENTEKPISDADKFDAWIKAIGLANIVLNDQILDSLSKEWLELGKPYTFKRLD